jgi:hypothetical protein
MTGLQDTGETIGHKRRYPKLGASGNMNQANDSFGKKKTGEKKVKKVHHLTND